MLRAMFMQVEIKNDDQHSSRFLWTKKSRCSITLASFPAVYSVSRYFYTDDFIQMLSSAEDASKTAQISSTKKDSLNHTKFRNDVVAGGKLVTGRHNYYRCKDTLDSTSKTLQVNWCLQNLT